MAIITKKILPEWFEAIKLGKKKYELRLADFDIQEGDTLRLEEWVGEGENRKFTGRVIEKKIGYVRKVDMNAWLKQQPEINEKGMYVLQFADEAEEYDAQREGYGLFYLGIAFAIVAGLFVNIIHEQLKDRGRTYLWFVIVLFLVLLFFVDRLFRKQLSKNLKRGKGSGTILGSANSTFKYFSIS